MEKRNKKNFSLPITPESLFAYSIVEDPDFSPDGKRVAFVRMIADETSNRYHRSIWIVDAKGGTPPRQFTQGTSDSCPRWSLDGEKLAFISARRGKPQIFVLPVNGGEARQITQMPSGVSNLAWSPDSRWIAFNAASTAAENQLEDSNVMYNAGLQDVTSAWSEKHHADLRDPRLITKLPYRTGTAFFDGNYQHVYVVAVEGGVPKRLSSGAFHHAAPVWTKDSKSVLSNSNRAQSSGDENFELWSSIVRFDIKTGAEATIIPEVSEEGREVYLSPDGKSLAYTFVPKTESPYAEPYHVATSPLTPNAKSRIVSSDAQTVADFRWDSDSHHLLFLIHEEGDGKLVRIAENTSEPEVLLDGKRMIEKFTVSHDGTKIAYIASSPVNPSDLFLLDRKTWKTTQLTSFNADFEAAHPFATPTEFRYRSTDDVEIQGWFFRPIHFDPQKKYPVAVEIHGGPQIMWGNSFWHEFQVLCARGYYVFFCNPRGSAGYGAEFQRIREMGGYTDMPDIMNGVDELLRLESSADPDRLCVTGGSYGGFLTGWVVTHTDRFKAAVSQRGVYDELNMFGSGDIPESVEWYHGGAPNEKNLSVLWEYSPAAHAKNVTTPLLILHSEQDYRCPISQAESFFAHLRRNGNRDVQMLRFPREGHGLSRNGEPLHRIERLNRIVDWFDSHIGMANPFDSGVAADQLKAYLNELDGWKVSKNQLTRVVSCGNQDIALSLAERIHALFGNSKQRITLTILPDAVQIELPENEAGQITLNHLLFAAKFNKLFDL